jgi:hypothetical protein
LASGSWDRSEQDRLRAKPEEIVQSHVAWLEERWVVHNAVNEEDADLELFVF